MRRSPLTLAASALLAALVAPVGLGSLGCRRPASADARTDAAVSAEPRGGGPVASASAAASAAPSASGSASVAAPAAVASQSIPPGAGPPPIEVQAVEETGSMPKGATLSRDGTRFYVTNFGENGKRSVTVYDARTLRPLDAIDLPGTIVESAHSPDGKTLYVSRFDRHALVFVDIESKQVTHEVRVGDNPKIVVASPDGKSVFTANWSTNDVTQVDVATARVVRTLKVGKQPRGMAMTRSGKLFVANFFSDSIDVFEGDDLSTRHRIEVCKCPRHLALSPDDKTLYMSCLTFSQVHALDVATEKVVHTATVGDAPKSIDVSRDGRWIYTADYGTSRSVSVIDTTTFTSRVLPIRAMDRASGVAATADGHHALVTGWYDNHVYLVGFAGSGGDPEAAKTKMRKWEARPRHADPGD